MFSSYYEHLYNLSQDPTFEQPAEESMRKCFDPIHLPTISLPQLAQCNSSITQTELCSIIHYLSSNKAPGPDGFSSEYYKQFIHILSPYIISMFACSFTNRTQMSLAHPYLWNAYVLFCKNNGDRPVFHSEFIWKVDNCIFQEHNNPFVAGRSGHRTAGVVNPKCLTLDILLMGQHQPKLSQL